MKKTFLIKTLSMRRIILLLALVLSAIATTSAAEFLVKSFGESPNDLAAKKFSRMDINDETCAIIKVLTDLDELMFESNLGITHIEQKISEYWIYVSPGEKRLRIIRRGFIPLPYTIPARIQPGMVYTMVLSEKREKEGDYINNLGFLYLISQPGGAKVFINNEELDVNTPVQKTLENGTYFCRVEKDLYHTYYDTIKIEASKTTRITAELKPKFGYLNLSTLPESGAEIKIDGEIMMETTPVKNFRLASGSHLITVNKSQYANISQQIEIMEGDTLNLEIDMRPLFSELEIQTDPKSDIFIDNELKGHGLYQGRIQKGLHVIKISKEGYGDLLLPVEFKEGEKKVFNLGPKPIYGTISVTSMPGDADIYIGDRYYGKTPMIIDSLLIGNKTVEIRKEGFSTVKKEIMVEETVTNSMEATLDMGKEISIYTLPKGAEIFINGEKIGVSPLKANIGFGQNVIAIKKDNFEEISQTIEIEDDTELLNFDLSPKKYAVNFNSSPEGANIQINGKNSGQTPQTIRLEEGRYLLSLSKENHIPLTENIQVGEEYLNYDFKLNYFKERRRGKAMLLTALWPGAGRTYLKRGGNAWLFGFIGYGAATGAYFMYKDAEEKYEEYKAETNDRIRRDNLKEDYQDSYVVYENFAITAASVWGFNLLTTLLTSPDRPERFSIEYRKNQKLNTNELALSYNF